MAAATLAKRRDVAETGHARYDEMRWTASGCEALGFLRTMRKNTAANASRSHEGPGGYKARKNRMGGEQSRMKEDIDQTGWVLLGKEHRRVADQRVHLYAMRDPPWCEGGCETLKGKGLG